MSEQDFNHTAVEVSYSIYLAAYWPIAQNVGIWLGIKDEIYIYPHFLECRDNGDQQFQAIFFPRNSYTLCLCWMHWFVSHLIYLSLTKPTMQQCFRLLKGY